MQMKEIGKRLEEHGGLNIILTQAAKEWLADQGYDRDFGARPLRRALQRHIESPMSVSLLRGEYESGDTILVDVAEDQLTFTKGETPPQPTKDLDADVEEVAA